MITPDFNDIIFERRNMGYGAYLLRKNNNRVVVLSIVLAVFLCVMVVLISFLRNPEQKTNNIYNSVYLTMENLGAPGEEAVAPSPGEQPPPASTGPPTEQLSSMPLAENDIYSVPEIVDTVFLSDTTMALPVDSLPGETATNGSAATSGVLSGIGTEANDTGGGGEPGSGSGSGGSVYGGSAVYSVVEIMPKFKGGDIDKFREWVQKQTKYPEVATINNIHGKVYISFIVDNKGFVTNVKVLKGVDPLIDDEAVKAVKSSPKWTAGRQRGINVSVSYMIVLNFQI
jgi:periplasmic protein TonB